MSRLLKVVSIFSLVISGFNIISIPNKPYSNKYCQHITMTYDPFKNYDDKLTIIPSFQASIIVNNWINYISENNNENVPQFIYKSIYDMKIFISINREEKNTIIFAWTPAVSIDKGNVVYIISGKIVNSELKIYRIAQCPYSVDILSINSCDVVNDITEIVKLSPNIDTINYDELHKYDNRYLLSWNIDNI